MTILRTARFWFGIGVSALCLWLAVRHLPLAELRDAMRHAHYVWLVPAVLFQVWAVIARAQRWVVLLGQDARLVDSFWAQGMGYLFTNVLPLRMGEPARVLVMAQRCRLPVMQVATTAVVERLLDTATIVLALIAVLPWMQVPALVRRVGMACGVALLLAFVLLLCAVRFHHASERLWRALGARLPSLPVEAMVARWQEVVRGLAPLTHWQKAMPACGWSLGCWLFPLPCTGRSYARCKPMAPFLKRPSWWWPWRLPWLSRPVLVLSGSSSWLGSRRWSCHLERNTMRQRPWRLRLQPI